MNTKSIFLLCMWLFATCFLQAQDKMPQAISYQAVARDAQGKVVSEKTIGVKVEILKGSADGSVVFSETHTPTSSKTGTVNLLIGQGIAGSGTFASIDWGSDTYFLQLSMDLAGGSNYVKVSTTQMLPVPYALYAAKAGEVENGEGENNAPKFTFVTTDIDNTDDDLYCILSGELYKKGYEYPEGTLSVYDYINLECTILYLDGQDQELMISIDGLSDDDAAIGRSSCAGRMFDYHYENVADGNYKLVVRNKSGNVIKEYPFTFTARRSL
ncbi:hypothetical protein [uncultured Parabacteroides sp.]|uniref:hypothetical protein n=1 Tax=uncultured Parabacteroides sp. TaxID=512312 RepID=UPI002618EBB0|nr:hypothetical protein [uncultured Parabacteroides sp.]